MRLKFYILLILGLLASCDEVKKEYYSDGKLKSLTRIKNGMINGEVINYRPDGTLESKQFFKNNQLDGQSVFFYENGQVDSMVNYVNGVLNGTFLKFYSNGNIAKRGCFKNGNHVGLYYQYYPYDSGKVLYEAYLLNVNSESMQYYVKKFDVHGDIVDIDRSIIVSVPDSVQLNDSIGVEFEFLDINKYDSVIIVVGEFDDQFMPISSLDTLILEGNKARYKDLASLGGNKFIRGEWIGYNFEEDTDSLYQYSTSGYFEEKVRVYLKR